MGEISDPRAIALFLDMLAAERGAAANTLLAYGRDLEGASADLEGRLAGAAPADLERLFAACLLYTSPSPRDH
jgi:integrase/recombinase XerD